MDFVKPSVAIDDWPYGCLKINEEWYSYISGLLRRAEIAGYWKDDDQDAMDVISELISSWDTIPCQEAAMSYYENIGACAYCVEDVDGAAYAANTWTQIPFNFVWRQDGFTPVIKPSGAIILPAGGYFMRAWCGLGHGSTAYVSMRVTDGVAVDLTGPQIRPYRGAQYVLDYPIFSDGSTEIKLRIHSTEASVFGEDDGSGLPHVMAYVEFRQPVYP